MSEGRWRITVTAPDWGQDHLSSDAIVAYVDDELASGPFLRATQHLAQCRECAAQVVAQGQARAALRTATCPSLPTSLLSSLRSIPQEADLPPPPAGLSVTPDGQFVSVLRPERLRPERVHPEHRSDTVRVSAQAHDRRTHHRMLRLGTGVAVSGLAIGAIAFALPSAVDDSSEPVPAAANDVLGGPAPVGVASAVDAHLRLEPVTPERSVAPDSAADPLASFDYNPGSVPGP